MNIKNYFKVSHHTTPASVSLLLLRLFVGIAFIYHGSGKIQAPFHWIPEGANIHVPAFFQLLATISEFGGGIALVLGLIVPLASLGIAFTMIVAIYTHAVVYKDPFVNLAGGTSYESPAGYLVIVILLMVVGPGKFSIDKLIFGEK